MPRYSGSISRLAIPLVEQTITIAGATVISKTRERESSIVSRAVLKGTVDQIRSSPWCFIKVEAVVAAFRRSTFT